jgi:hypothetical protein
MILTLTMKQRQAVAQTAGPVEIRDEQSQPLYYLVPADEFQRMKAFLEAEEIDPSFFEFDDEDSDSRTADQR